MSLGIQQQLNATDYFRGGSYAVGVSGSRIAIRMDSQTVVASGVLFCDKLGLWQAPYMARPNNNTAGVVRFDPFLIDNTPSVAFLFPYGTAGSNQNWALSAYIPSSNTQDLYFPDGTLSTSVWQRMAYVTDPTAISVANPFPNIGLTAPQPATGFTTGVQGFWSTNFSGVTNFLFFEGWDHDDSGNTLGTMVVGGGVVNDGVDELGGAFVQVNLTTGEGIPLLGLSTQYEGSPNKYQSDLLFGATVLFLRMQFLPDNDTAPNAPKGRLFFSGYVNNGQNYYVQIVAFNPRNVTTPGQPSRTHLEVEQLTRLTIVSTIDQSTFPGVTSTTMINSSATDPDNQVLFNRLSGRPTLLGSAGINISEAEYDADAYLQTALEWTAFPVAAQISPPQPRQDVETNRVIVFGADVLGDLGEFIPGVDVNWTLERISSQAETLTFVGAGEPRQPGDAADAVVNAPIDRNNLFPFAVKEDGVALVEGVDYTVVASTGIVTFLAPKPLQDPVVYTADYGHPTVAVSPAFGALLNATSSSDSAGEATTRVQYADDDADAGFVDQLTVDDT